MAIKRALLLSGSSWSSNLISVVEVSNNNARVINTLIAVIEEQSRAISDLRKGVQTLQEFKGAMEKENSVNITYDGAFVAKLLEGLSDKLEDIDG